MTGIDVAGGRVRGVQTSVGDIAAPVVINAAGPWGALVAAMVGIELHITPALHQATIVETPPTIDPTVGGIIIPSRVAVHTVALGYDADETLMASIAAQTDGRFFTAGIDNLPLAAASDIRTVNTPPGPNLSPSLPNRLTDIYKAIGERIGHQQRLWERVGEVNGKEVFEVPLEKGVPEAIFAVNWTDRSWRTVVTQSMASRRRSSLRVLLSRETWLASASSSRRCK